MVALATNFANRFVPPTEALIAGRMRLVSLTRKDAEAMMRLGIIPEDASTELLNGWIFLKDRSAVGQDPTMIGKDHRTCVERFSDLRSKINGVTRHVESQQPLVCTEIHVPEPDFVVLRGTLNDYTDLPTAADAFCVIEVADSSYERDTGQKLIAYARAGVRQYIVINLRNRTAEVYTVPDMSAGTYPPPRIVGEREILSLRVGENETFDLALAEILP